MPRRSFARTGQPPRHPPKHAFRRNANYAAARRHAMDDGTGNVARCWPTLDEQRGHADSPPPGTDGKPAYPTELAARCAAADVAKVTGRAPREVYACPRSSPALPGHYHVVGQSDDR